jgi:hypothetical protein
MHYRIPQGMHGLNSEGPLLSHASVGVAPQTTIGPISAPFLIKISISFWPNPSAQFLNWLFEIIRQATSLHSSNLESPCSTW